MPQFHGNDDQPRTIMPDLPGDPYGRDTDLYPPVQEFMRFDYWDESNLAANFENQPSASDMVVHSRYSEIPSRGSTEQHANNADLISRRRSRQPRRDRSSGRVMSADRLDIVYDISEAPASVARKRPAPRTKTTRANDEVMGTAMQASAIPADVVTGVSTGTRRADRQRRTSRRSHGRWNWSPIVMPSIHQVLEQAVPTLTMALSLLLSMLIVDRIPFIEVIWALVVLAPSVALFMVADPQIHPLWRRSALLNLAAVGVFYPLLIVRQSYLRVPFVEWGNGTLTMPMVSTFTVTLLLMGLAIAAAWMSQDDPEYAGVLFLPAAMLVPFFAGATEIVSLRSALIIAATVFLFSSVMTVIASVLPGSFPMLVAPIALALEFFVLPLAENVPIFPVGAGMASKLLFFVLLATTVGLTFAMPSLANWVRSVRDLVHYGLGDTGIAR